jgi:hypothetical protein
VPLLAAIDFHRSGITRLQQVDVVVPCPNSPWQHGLVAVSVFDSVW